MNCTEFNHHLTQGVDQELDAAEQGAFDAHRASCESCRALYASEQAMLAALRAMPVAEPPAGFADRVLANAIKQNVAQQQDHHRRGFVVGFGSAAAAALALWVAVGMTPNQPADRNVTEQTLASAEPVVPAAKPPVLSIALNTQQTIRLAFASSEPLQGARITIRLPENVALVGYPGRRELSWETNLKKGDNLLSLPVIATQVASGELVADIEYAGQVKTLRLSLEASAAETSSKNIGIPPSIG